MFTLYYLKQHYILFLNLQDKSQNAKVGSIRPVLPFLNVTIFRCLF